MSKAEQRALEAYPYEDGTKGMICSASREIFIKGYEQAEKDFFIKAEKWLCEIHRVCDITDEHGYWIDVRELIGRFEEYIKQ